uniref:Uncharacterized protein n=1 Tax=Podoviridae sp. ct8Lf7 TaxID=2827723 RepID=A0A8S5S0T2_9CAUD|nr:MAG TPA: hypothetical protein [Podoviridae sp. ct8Lf7]
MFSYKFPLAKAETHVSTNMNRLVTAALDCLSVLRQSFILTVLKRMEMSIDWLYHIFNL